MGDQMRFFSSQSPQSAKSNQSKPNNNSPEFRGPGHMREGQGGLSQGEYLARVRDEIEMMRSGDKTRVSWMWSHFGPDGRETAPDVTTEKKPVVQSKLTVGAVDDPLEKEADDVADRVMRASAEPIADRPLITPIARSLQRYTLPDSLREANGEPKHNPLLGRMQRSQAHTLPESSRAFFGKSFGRKFDNVRVHTDDAANEAAESIQAKAFTHGNDIYFNKNEYSPESDQGKRLIAHELTHVVQQSGGHGAIQRKSSDDTEVSEEAPAPSTDPQMQALQSLGYASYDELEQDFKQNISRWSTIEEEQDYLALLDDKGFVTNDLRSWAFERRVRAEEAAHFERLAKSARVAIARHEGPREKVAEIKDENGNLVGYNTTDWAYDLSGKAIYKIASDAMTDAGLLDPIELAADIMTGGTRRIGKEVFETIAETAAKRGIRAALSEGAQKVIYESLKGSSRVLKAKARGQAQNKVKQEIQKARTRTVGSALSKARLPTSGKIRYIPPKNWHPSEPLPRGPNKGYMDRNRNEWTQGPSRTKGQPFEWDVQLGANATPGMRKFSRDGKHLNVSLDGKVTHK